MDQKRIQILAVIGFVLLGLAACSPAGGSSSAGVATPTPLPTPIIPEKPTYTVQVGTVVQTLDFTGRASPVQEQELYFEADGIVDEVFVERSDWVQAGDLLAQLDISSQERQLARQQLSLQTVELRLQEAEEDLAQGLVEARLALEDAQRALEQARAVDTQITLMQATRDLENAVETLDSAQKALEQARTVDTQITIRQVTRDLENAIEALDNAREAYATAWAEHRDWETFWDHPICDPGEKEPCTGQTWAARINKERESTAANLPAAEYNLETAQLQYDQSMMSVESELERLEREVEAAQVAVEVAQLQYDQSMFSVESELERLEREVEAAQLAIEELEEGIDPQLAIDLENAKLDIDETEQAIAASQLFAPFDGQITSLGIDPGDRPTAYTAVMVLADPTKLEITAELGSEELNEMSINQEALITLRNRPEETLSGYVRLLPYPYGGGTGEATSDDTAVHIALVDDVALEMGELATVVIVLQEKENVLWLPPAAIRTYQGRDFVVIQLEDGQQRSDVLLGIVTDERVEIEAGIEAGQIIVGE
jgi:multidrug efflux pump subunit AcrA (membrane-fusion protein)